jgi:SAM-dependent methyltransferase
MFMRERTSVFTDADVRLLHFAPEPSLSRHFRARQSINYVTTDLEMSSVSIRMNITDLLFRDDTFDFILCSHVLEHVVDDRRAMRELNRVLKPTGCALVLVPVFPHLENTYEDVGITSFEERASAFAQGDHVRQPGLDYPNRLIEAGFVVDVVDYPALVGEEVSRHHGLLNHGMRDLIFVCSKITSRAPSG